MPRSNIKNAEEEKIDTLNTNTLYTCEFMVGKDILQINADLQSITITQVTY
jgi:hypothetical protein